MSLFLVSLISVVVVLGIMIVVHEFGHFAVAKLCGVRVDVFSVGFGKRLFGVRRGDTDYRVSLIPLGGYVKMAGENPMDTRSGDPHEFLARPRWQRFLIAMAGPAMNILLAIALLTGVYMVRFERPAFADEQVTVGWVEPGSPAEKAGLQVGDHVLRVDGAQNPTWETLAEKVLLSPSQPLPMEVQRGTQALQVSLVPATDAATEMGGDIGVAAARPVIVQTVEAGQPAARGGMRVGDRIVALNGAPVFCLEDVVDRIQQNKDKPLHLTVERGSQRLELSMTPVYNNLENVWHYRLGFTAPDLTKVVHLPFVAALGQSLQDNKRFSLLFVELVKKVVERKVSVRQFQGPIGIGRAAGEAALQPGWVPLLFLTALISLQLGILNLLPVPILDGGMILMLLIEGAMRREINLRLKERIYQVAFVMLVLFAGMVIYNDLVKTVPGLSKYLP